LKRTSKNKQKPTWERAYKGHVLWLGKQKLGKVTLEGPGRYQWEGGGRKGFAEQLSKAKAAVELAAFTADKQLDLFR
jgi:hypothetical protein